MALRKNAINQIAAPQKGETWAGAGSPVSRPSPSVSRSSLSRAAGHRVTSPSMICKTAMVLPNRSGRLITWRDGVQPVPLHNPRTRHHVAHSTDRDEERVEILIRRDRLPIVVQHRQAHPTWPPTPPTPPSPPSPPSSYAHAFFLPSVASSLRCRALVGHGAHIAAGDAGCQPAHPLTLGGHRPGTGKISQLPS